MKRFIVALTVMIGTVFVFMFDSYSNIESKYDYIPPTTSVYVVNSDLEVIRFANKGDKIPQYMERQMDLLCEIDSVKYYLVD